MLFDELDFSDNSPPPPPQLKGISNSIRYWAAFFDQILATICFYVLVSIAREFLPRSGKTTTDVVIGVLVITFYFGYFFVWEALFSATPGKMWYGLTVRHLDGSTCSVTSAFFRTILRVFEVNPIALGYLPAVVSIHCTSRNQRLGDLLAGTVVVDRRSVP